MNKICDLFAKKCTGEVSKKRIQKKNFLVSFTPFLLHMSIVFMVEPNLIFFFCWFHNVGRCSLKHVNKNYVSATEKFNYFDNISNHVVAFPN